MLHFEPLFRKYYWFFGYVWMLHIDGYTWCEICQEVVMKRFRGQFTYLLSLNCLLEGLIFFNCPIVDKFSKTSSFDG